MGIVVVGGIPKVGTCVADVAGVSNEVMLTKALLVDGAEVCNEVRSAGDTERKPVTDTRLLLRDVGGKAKSPATS